VQEPVLDEPVVVLTSARSGSTLLRLILDAHPDLACPAETNFIKVCSQLASVWHTLDGTGHRYADSTSHRDGDRPGIGDSDGRGIGDSHRRGIGDSHGRGIGDSHGPADGDGVPQAARDGIKALTGAVFGDYLRRRGKRRWCDKSLGTASVAGWFTKIYPKAKFICLYRHGMDVIDSGLEASPWGLIGYGFEQFSGPQPGNTVSALTAYWIEHTGRILGFERENGGRCLRVYYERLVAAPEVTAGEIFSFLGVDCVPGITTRCFTSVGADAGPGDHKIRATSKITADSVGRGARIPVAMIPSLQLKVMNHLLEELGYTAVDDAWRKSPFPPAPLRPPDADPPGPAAAEPTAPTADQAVPEGSCQPRAEGAPVLPPGDTGDRLVRSVLERIGRVFCARIAAAFALASAGVARPVPGRGAFALVAYHPDEHKLARSWRIDLETGNVAEPDLGEGTAIEADWLVTGDVETWLAVLAGRANMSACMRSGTLRYIALDDEGQTAQDALLSGRAEERLQVARQLLGLAGYPEEVG
jgi:Sulfotransferase family